MDSVLQHRFASARTASRYAYIYTDEPDGERTGFSLVQIDKASGRPTGRVWLDERRPEYIIDPFTGIVFHMVNMWGPIEIRAYRFAFGDGGEPPP
jgi:hypothetical protein